MRRFFAVFAAGLAIGMATVGMASARDAQTDAARSAPASPRVGTRAPADRRADPATSDRPTTTSRGSGYCERHCLGERNPINHGLCVQSCLATNNRPLLRR